MLRFQLQRRLLQLERLALGRNLPQAVSRFARQPDFAVQIVVFGVETQLPVAAQNQIGQIIVYAGNGKRLFERQVAQLAGAFDLARLPAGAQQLQLRRAERPARIAEDHLLPPGFQTGRTGQSQQHRAVRAELAQTAAPAPIGIEPARQRRLQLDRLLAGLSRQIQPGFMTASATIDACVQFFQ